MKKKSLPKNTASEIEQLRDLSERVGDFIRYWGFRRIHGQLWTQIFLSKDRLSGADLTKRLKVSKALISPALVELEKHGLIHSFWDGKKTKRYEADPNVVGVIKNILIHREYKIIEAAKKSFELLESPSKSNPTDSLLSADRLAAVGEMIHIAEFALQFLLNQSTEQSLQFLSEEATKITNHKGDL